MMVSIPTLTAIHPHTFPSPASADHAQLGIAWALRRENNRRDRLTATGEIKVEKFYDENGEEIDSTFLDMTDVGALTPAERALEAVRLTRIAEEEPGFQVPPLSAPPVTTAASP